VGAVSLEKDDNTVVGELAGLDVGVIGGLVGGEASPLS